MQIHDDKIELTSLAELISAPFSARQRTVLRWLFREATEIGVAPFCTARAVCHDGTRGAAMRERYVSACGL